MKELNLLDLTEEYIEVVRQWRNSPEVSKYMYTDAVITSEQQLLWFESITGDDRCKHWIIKYGDLNVGVASITDIDRSLDSCYWAFYLGDTSIRGAGIGAKVECKILEYVFEVLKLNKLRCEVFNFNYSVIKMHEKFGFRREAFYREHCKKDGKYEDVVGLALLKSEWKKMRNYIMKIAYGR